MFRHVLLIGFAVVLAPPTRLAPCSVIGPLPTPQEVVERATLIVHSRAVGVVSGPPESFFPRPPVRFQVISALKGKLPAVELIIDGTLRAGDDWNTGSVPYRSVRPAGDAGCYAWVYKQGAEYVLLLKPTAFSGGEATSLSPYWAPLSPTNEQVRGASDPWLIWVAEQVKKSARSTPKLSPK